MQPTAVQRPCLLASRIAGQGLGAILAKGLVPRARELCSPFVFISEAGALRWFVEALQRDFAGISVEITFEACHNPSAYMMVLSRVGIVESWEGRRSQ